MTVSLPLWSHARIDKIELKIPLSLIFRLYSLIEKNGSYQNIEHKCNRTMMSIKKLALRNSLPYFLLQYFCNNNHISMLSLEKVWSQKLCFDLM